MGKSSASYVGAVPGRAANVELAARRIDGATLAPGEAFSFLDCLGPQTFEAGFQIGYGVVTIDGQPRTVPMIGGGICDVSTILFQAAFRAGLGIVERHYHSFWIEHYGAPPDGGIGLDATVDVQPVDFKFRNTTTAPLKIACTYQNQIVSLKLLGTNPGWTVTLGKPVIANVVKTDATVLRQPDPTLATGTQVVVETARDGFDVSWDRQVTLGNQLVDRYQFTNRYLPSRNIIAIGTIGATATPSTTPTPSTLKIMATTTPAAGLSLNGSVQVPNLVGLPEVQAKPLIVQAGLTITTSNYQGPDVVPVEVLKRYGIGAVISQIPPPGTIVPKGSKVFLAVRRV